MPSNWLTKYKLITFDEIDSTNSEAIRMVKAGLSGNFVLCANSQSAGRGRYGKTWQSDTGNLYISIILDNQALDSTQHQYSFVTGLALFDAIEALAKKESKILEIFLKWPNDLLINDRKIAGILLESVIFNKKRYLIIGIGINVTVHPDNINQPATSLLSHGMIISTKSLLDIFMQYFDRYCIKFEKTGFITTRKHWLQRAYKINNIITVNDGINTISGIFHDIDLTGNIRIITSCGQMVSISTGEIYISDA